MREPFLKGKNNISPTHQQTKVESVFSMVIRSEFHIGRQGYSNVLQQYIDSAIININIIENQIHLYPCWAV